MDIISHYSAYTPARTSAARQPGTKLPDARSVSGDEFLDMVKAQSGRHVDESSKLYDGSAELYNGSTTRAKLSDTEIAMLANKYDPHNMDQDTYDDFLDDLEDMGAISYLEKRELGYNGFMLIAYKGTNGETVYCGSPSGVYRLPDSDEQQMYCIIPWGADADLHKWLGQRTRKELVNVFEPSDWEAAEGYEKLLKTMFGIVDRMEVRRTKDEEAVEKAELVRQLADKNSDFYTNMRTQLKAKVDQNEDDREQQAIIDAMAAVLDAMSGREPVSGEKTSVNKSASDLTQKIGERISKLDPDDPERIKLENMLKRFQEMGIYIDLGDTDDLWQDEDETFETLSQFLIRRQAEETYTAHPIINEVNEPA